MNHRIPVAICLLGCVLVMISYQLENVLAQVNCNEFCLEFYRFCETDANKKCKANKCFFYHFGDDIANYAFNCWPCGDGPGMGRCPDGDKDKECKATTEAVIWEFTESCDPACDVANSRSLANDGGKIVGNGSGFRYECVKKNSGG